MDPVNPPQQQILYVPHGELLPVHPAVREVNLDNRIPQLQRLHLLQRNGERVNVGHSFYDALNALGEGVQGGHVLPALSELLDEVVVHARHVREGGDNDVLETTFLDFLVNSPLVLQRVAAQLTDRTFANGVIQYEAVQVAKDLSFL